MRQQCLHQVARRLAMVGAPAFDQRNAAGKLRAIARAQRTLEPRKVKPRKVSCRYQATDAARLTMRAASSSSR
jgi:hypothetical protein